MALLSVCCRSQLRSITEETEVGTLTVGRKSRLKGTGKRELPIGGGASPWQATRCSCLAPLSLHVGLLHWRFDADVLPQGSIVVFASVHAALAPLPAAERLRPQVHGQLPAWLPR